MSPIEITSVDYMNVATYAAIGLSGISLLCVLLALVDKFMEYRSSVKGNPYISMTHRTLSKAAFVLFILALLAFAISSALYANASEDSADAAITQLEQETGVTILDKDSILPAEILVKENSILVSFKYENSVQEGRLIIEDGSMLLYAERTSENGDELVVFGS